MTLDPEDVVWMLDARGGIGRMLADLVGGLMVSLQALMPPSSLHVFEDPFAAMAADEDFDALSRIDGVRLRRLFPQPVNAEHDTDHEAWEGLARARATALHAHARMVLADVEQGGERILVHEAAVTAWLQTLGALRAGLHAELTGSASPSAEPTVKELAQHPALVAVLDWLAYTIEELLRSRAQCQRAGAPLDIAEPEDGQ